MNKYSIFKINGCNQNYVTFYNHLLACVQTACRDSECSKRAQDILFSLYLTELNDFGIVYCLGTKFEIVQKGE